MELLYAGSEDQTCDPSQEDLAALPVFSPPPADVHAPTTVHVSEGTAAAPPPTLRTPGR